MADWDQLYVVSSDESDGEDPNSLSAATLSLAGVKIHEVKVTSYPLANLTNYGLPGPQGTAGCFGGWGCKYQAPSMVASEELKSLTLNPMVAGIHVGEVIAAVNGTFLLEESYSKVTMAIVECGHVYTADGATIMLSLVSLQELEDKGLLGDTHRRGSRPASLSSDTDDHSSGDEAGGSTNLNDAATAAVTVDPTPTTDSQPEVGEETRDEYRWNDLKERLASPTKDEEGEADESTRKGPVLSPPLLNLDLNSAALGEDPLELVKEAQKLKEAQKERSKRKSGRRAARAERNKLKHRSSDTSNADSRGKSPKKASVVAIEGEAEVDGRLGDGGGGDEDSLWLAAEASFEVSPRPHSPDDQEQLARAKAVSEKVQQLAESAREELVESPRRSETALEWRTMQTALTKKLGQIAPTTAVGSGAGEVVPQNGDALPTWLSKVERRRVWLHRWPGVELGFLIQNVQGAVCTSDVKSDSPASAAGLCKDDIVLLINDHCTENLSTVEVGAHIGAITGKFCLTVCTRAAYNDAVAMREKVSATRSVKKSSSPRQPSGTRKGDDGAESVAATEPQQIEPIPATEILKQCELAGPRRVRITREEGDSSLGIRLYTPRPTWTNPEPRGILIAKIFEGSPAERVGALSVGDVIVDVNGTPVVDATHGEVVELIKSTFSRKYPSLVGEPATLTGMPGKAELDGTPVRCVKLLNESTGSHLIELESGKTLAVAGKNLIPAEDHSDEVNCVVFRVLPNADFLRIMRSLERLRRPLPRPKQTQEFTEREEKRTITEVLKQNLVMGVITQEEYDHLTFVNQQTLSPEPAEDVSGTVRARRMLKQGSAWVKKTAEKLKMSPAPTDGLLSRENWDSVKPLPMAPLEVESDEDGNPATGSSGEDAGGPGTATPVSPDEVNGPSDACEKTPASHAAPPTESTLASEAKKKKARRRVIEMDD